MNSWILGLIPEVLAVIGPSNSKICSGSAVNFDLVSVLFNNGFGSDRGRNSAIRWRCSEGYFTGSRRIGFLRSPRGSMVRLLTDCSLNFVFSFRFYAASTNAKLLQNVKLFAPFVYVRGYVIALFSSFMQAQFSTLNANWDNAMPWQTLYL